MILDVRKLEEKLQNAVEKRQSDNKTDFIRLLQVVSGNKFALQKASLDDIAEMIENLDDILINECSPDSPVIDMRKLSRSCLIMRRAI